MRRAEHDPAPRRALSVLVGMLACVGAAVAAMLAWLQPPSATAPPPVQALEGPALQSAPRPDLAAYRARKQAELASVGPLPDAPGWVRIPLDDAMDLLSTRGLRATGAPAEAAR